MLNGRDYGIPQNRERIYCVGFKYETEFKYPAPIPLEKTLYDFLQDTFDTKYLLKERGVHFITESVNHQKSYTQINGDLMLCQKRNQQFNWHGDFVFHPALVSDDTDIDSDDYLYRLSDYEEDYFKDKSPEKYAITPVEGGEKQKMIRENHQPVDNSKGRFRKLMPRECLRLMGFDDTFNVVVSDTAAYKQAGNSIIVDVLMALLKQIDITRYGTDV